MKLTFKDLKQQKFTLDAEPTITVGELKKKIFEHKKEEKEWAPSLQKLIYSGKILMDDKTIEFYKVEEKGFIVCMLAKPKAPTAASSSATPVKAPSTPAQTSKTSTPSAPGPAAAASATTTAPPATPSPAGTSAGVTASFNDPSALAIGSALEIVISNITDMGFPRDDVIRALHAAYNNPDRAVEYLMTGIPEHLQGRAASPQAPAAATGGATAEAAASQPAAPAAHAATSEPADDQPVNLFEAAAAQAAGRQAGAGARASASAGTGAAAGNALAGLDFLRNNPQFQQLRRLVQEAPHMLEPILQQVGSGNPQLAALISQNPEAFLQLLSEGFEGEEDEGGLGGGGGQMISVTPEEAEAIDRLCQLGFQRNLVIQAYIACDKDEELAANYLFEHADDEMDEA